MQRKDVSDLEVLRAVAAFRPAPLAYGQTPDEALADRWPPKVILAKMEQLVSQGYLDYGVSLRTAWLTEKGQTMLAALNGLERADG